MSAIAKRASAARSLQRHLSQAHRSAIGMCLWPAAYTCHSGVSHVLALGCVNRNDKTDRPIDGLPN